MFKTKFGLVLALIAFVVASSHVGQTNAQANLRVTLAGTFQVLLGANSNWNPSDPSTQMVEVEPGIYEFVALLPKGQYEYKLTTGGSWAENYGKDSKRDGPNIVMVLNPDNGAKDAVVRFVFNSQDKTIMDSVNNSDKVIAPNKVPAIFIRQPVVMATADANGDSTRLVVHYHRSDAEYEAWNLWVWVSKPNGLEGKAYKFTAKDDFGAMAVIDVPGKATELGFIVRRGEWEAKDIEADRFVDVQNGKAEIWVLQNTRPFELSRSNADAAVVLQQKKPQHGDPAFLDASDTVRAFMVRAVEPASLKNKVRILQNGKALKIKEIVGAGPAAVINNDTQDPNKVVVAGTIQSVLGGTDWNANGDVTRMTETTPGVFELVVVLPKGSYEYKVAKGGSWEKNWGENFEPGGQNIALNVNKDNTVVRFVTDFNMGSEVPEVSVSPTGSLKDSVNNPEIVAPLKAPVRPKQKPVLQTGPSQVIAFKLAESIKPSDIAKTLELKIEGQLTRTIFAREVLSEKAFWYSGNDLGSRYSKNQTTFKVWSPVSASAELLLFKDANAGPEKILDMQRGPGGVWQISVPGDWHGHFYQYRLKSYGETRVTPDIYCFAASKDSKRSMVVDLSRTNPAGWNTKKVGGPTHKHTTDSVIYELMIRDFTIDASSGLRQDWRGKYLGMAVRGTRVPDSDAKTGLDYLLDLGVTDVHIMPFQNMNPKNSGKYNWGYETNLFNVPEEDYSTTPGNPTGTIREVKTMLRAMQDAGLRVVMDVVYNHSMPAGGYGTDGESAFWDTVPFYYFRTNDRGELLNESGVGNAMHDEHPMVRKYIRESLLYWVQEYGVDGFRFDLIGMFAKSTVENLAKSLQAVRPDLTIYGEPWTGGGPTRFGKGAQKNLGVAVFNDNYRNALRGDLSGTKAGFAMGALASPTNIKRGIVGSIQYSDAISDFAAAPTESINYISAHDDMSLGDQVRLSMKDQREELQEQAVRFAGALLLTSQGVPFLEGGAEMGRTKQNVQNTYNRGDELNRFDWARGTGFTETTDFYKGLIELRKAHPAFRAATIDAIRSSLKFLPDDALPFGVIGFTLADTNDAWKKILVFHNGTRNATTTTLPAGDWQVVVNQRQAGTETLATATNEIELDALSSFVLYQN